MRAMLLHETCDLTRHAAPLSPADLPVPEPASGEVRIKVSCCAVCHTELDEIEGRTPPPRYPVVPGHQVVGVVDALGENVKRHRPGERVGVGWIFSACGRCEYCLAGNENLCPDFQATGRDHHGGYAEYLCVPEAFAIPLPAGLDDEKAAPLFCAGAIGYRSLALSGIEDGERLGLTGFGASGHLVLKMVRHRFPNTDVYVFARDAAARAFALELGAVWSGETEARSPLKLNAIIDTTPAWSPIVSALRQLAPGGRLVVNAIRKEDRDLEALLELDYAEHLWLEKEIKSVANVTRRDIIEFLELAVAMGIDPEIECYPLESANQALVELKRGGVRGARVLVL